MTIVTRPVWKRYGFALLCAAAATVLTALSTLVFEASPFLLYWAAGAVSAWYGGFGAGVVCMLLSVVGANYWFMPPLYTIHLEPIDIPRIGVFVLIAFLIDHITRANREAEARQKLLIEWSTLLASSLDYHTTLAQVARCVVPAFADWCILDIAEDDGRLHRLEVIHANPEKQALANHLKQIYPVVEPDQKHTLLQVIQSNKSWLDSKVNEERFWREARDPAHGALLQALGFRSEIIVQLRARGRLLGTFTLVYGDSGRRYRAKDVPLAEELARRAALAMDNALLYREAQEQGKRLEEALRREQEARSAAEEANEIKLKFLAMVSHELRTPLTSIKGFISSLLATDVSWDAEQQREFLEIALSETDKLTELVEQLLDVSRIAAGILRIQKAAHTLPDIIEAARAELEAVTAHHHFTVQIAPDLPLVQVDRRRIGQVLTNLVHNAAKYSPPGSAITVMACHDPSGIRIDVSDEGAGIPPKDRHAVFEAFKQVHKNTPQRGAGLGLAICKGLVEAHGGRIWIQERDGPGTTVSFTLPTVAETAPTLN